MHFGSKGWSEGSGHQSSTSCQVAKNQGLGGRLYQYGKETVTANIERPPLNFEKYAIWVSGIAVFGRSRNA
jgi:hypothetical protein